MARAKSQAKTGKFKRSRKQYGVTDFRMPLPRTRSALEKLLRQQIPENLHLDYKSSLALANDSNHKEIGKDVSAFLNSDGGLIVYGIRESGHLPVSLDDGVDHSQFTRERLEQIILSHVSPRPPGIEITQIPLSATNSVFCVAIPKGLQPYQDSISHRYYKRFNFQSVPMEHYEIEDVRLRRVSYETLIAVKVEIRQGVMVYVVIENLGTLPATNVSFEFNPPLLWSDRKEPPPLIRRGAKFFPPGQRYHFMYDTYQAIVDPKGNHPAAFSVTVRYNHPAREAPMEDRFEFDLFDHFESSDIESETYRAGTRIAEAIKEITRHLEHLASAAQHLKTVAGSTGLNLSVPTLRNLRHIAANSDNIEKLDPVQCDYRGFQDVLGVDFQLAYKLERFFRRHGPEKLAEIEGMTADILKRIDQLFRIKDST